jgi:hypothetical protein
MTNFQTLFKLVISSTLIGALLACGSAGTPDFGQMSAKYANTLEQYQINMIFQNVIRSSENRPVSFLDMPSINGSGSITTNPYASAFFTGGILPYNASYLPINGGLNSITPGVSLTVGNTFNFTQSSLDNAVFWKGYLNELPIETVKYFDHNHIPKEVILSLLISQIEVTDSNGKTVTLINNPLRPDYPEFQKQLYELVNAEFGAYPITSSAKLGPPLNMQQVRTRFGDVSIEKIKESGIAIKQISGAPNFLYQPIQITKEYKLCMRKDLYTNFVSEPDNKSWYCQDTHNLDNAQKSAAKKSQPTLTVSMRSTNNIFEFMGQVTRAQLQGPPFILTLPPTAKTFNTNRGDLNKYALLVVEKNKSTPRPFSSIEALDGITYTIPSENNGYSALSIKLLAQLMSLQKIPGSIPPSPAVLIK